MAGLLDCIRALTDQIRSVYEQVEEPAFQVEPVYIVNPSPPTIDVYLGETPARDPETAGFGDELGGYWVTVRFRMLTADAQSDAGQEVIYELADDDSEFSLSAAILEDPTLDGYASSLYIDSGTGMTVYPDASGAGAWLGFEYRVHILAAHS